MFLPHLHARTGNDPCIRLKFRPFCKSDFIGSGGGQDYHSQGKAGCGFQLRDFLVEFRKVSPVHSLSMRRLLPCTRKRFLQSSARIGGASEAFGVSPIEDNFASLKHSGRRFMFLGPDRLQTPANSGLVDMLDTLVTDEWIAVSLQGVDPLLRVLLLRQVACRSSKTDWAAVAKVGMFSSRRRSFFGSPPARARLTISSRDFLASASETWGRAPTPMSCRFLRTVVLTTQFFEPLG